MQNKKELHQKLNIFLIKSENGKFVNKANTYKYKAYQNKPHKIKNEVLLCKNNEHSE